MGVDDFTDITGDGGVKKTIINEGEESKSEHGARIWIQYRLTTLDDQELDARKYSFRLGRGVVIRGLEKICETMKLKEKCEAILSPEYAFGDKGFKGLAKGENVKVEVELLAMEGGSKDIREMGARERFQLAVEWKEKGNAFFKDAKYEKAKGQYEKCLSCLEYLFYKTKEQKKTSEDTEISGEDVSSEKVADKETQAAKSETNMAENGSEADKKEDDVEKDHTEQQKVAEKVGGSDAAVSKENGEHAEEQEMTNVMGGDAQDFGSEKPEHGKESVENVPVEQNGESDDKAEVENGPTEASAQEPAADTNAGREEEVENGPNDPTDEEIRDVRVASLNNLALSLFKLGDNKGTVNRATLSLQISQESNYKAMYYRGRAQVQLGMWDEARQDLIAAAKLAPKNMGIRIELKKLDRKVEQHKSKEKRAAAAMFG
eukprot:Plantae.Rhodophyta-Hildenbrandia_rubra.ctg10041.p2 GENE.Plantae.Rhodophyta-Hildenbrandia_rubra.ctg10041~~Plantae.Rhodophyta-Hildenbrandia_rubra.ctg10041.p2  ORF type:complete len:432 (-),score=123.60 Plantae.Rhodophyta-Hildenbrandia_rubra.ctg10041:2060-3355(-)